MDDTLENSYQRQFKVSSYFSNNIDLKLKQMNLQEDTSQWSESIKKITNPQKEKHSYDYSDLFQQSIQQCEVSSCKDLSHKKDELQVQQYLSNRCIVNEDMFGVNSNMYFQQEDTNILFSPKSPKSYDQLMALKSTDVRQNAYRKNNENRTTEMHSIKIKENSLSYTNHNLFNLQKLNIMVLAKIKFYLMRFYKQNTIYGFTLQLNQKIRRFINDKSDVIVIEQTSTNYIRYQIIKYYKKYFSCFYKMPLLNVQGNFGFSVQILFTLLNCLFMYLFTLIFIFQGFNKEEQQIQSYIRITWVIEILIYLNTAPYYISSIKCDRKSIFNDYIKERSLYDLLPIIMLNIQSSYQILQIIIHMLIFLKLRNVIRDLNYLQKRICMKVKRYYIVQIFNLLFQLFLIGHIICCFWFIIAKIEYNLLGSDYSWFDDLRVNDNIWWHYYIWSLYWSLTLMTTGSNTANTLLQASFTTIILLFTTISFGYFLNEISIILSEMDESLQQKRKDVNIINEYMHQKKISKNLQAQVNIDLEYYYINNFKKICDDNNQVLDKISVDLKNSLLKEYNKQILNKITFLNQNFSESLIEELSLILEEEYYLPNQMILKESDQHQIFLIYIISGQVELNKIEDLQIKKTNKEIHLFQNQVYGESNFFTGQSNKYCLRSLQFSKVLRIDRNKFIKLLQERQKDFEVFYQIKDQILFNNDQSSLNKNCLSCNSSNHIIDDCQQLHFNKSKASQKARFLQSQNSQRSQTVRKARKSVKTIIDMKYLQELAKQARAIIQSKQLTTNKFYTVDFSNSSLEDQEQSESAKNNLLKNEILSPSNGNGLDVISLKVCENESLRKSMQKLEGENILSRQLFSAMTSDMNSKTIQCTQSQESMNEIEEEGIEAMKNYLKEQNDQYNSLRQAQHESLRKFYADSTKNIKRDSYDLLKPINCSENLQVYKDTSEIDSNQLYQKLQNKLKLNRKSILKQNQRHSLYVDSEENRIDLTKSIRKLFQRTQTEFKDEKTDELPFTSTVMKISFNDNDFLFIDNKNVWEFDQLKDYSFYFENGNSKYQIYKINRYLKKKQKKKSKKQRKQ